MAGNLCTDVIKCGALPTAAETAQPAPETDWCCTHDARVTAGQLTFN